MSNFIGFLLTLSLAILNISFYIAAPNWWSFSAGIVCTFCAGFSLSSSIVFYKLRK